MLETASVSDMEVAREAAIAERVARHGSVLRFFGACIDGSLAHRCLVSEWCPRGSLEKSYRRNPSELFSKDGSTSTTATNGGPPLLGGGGAWTPRPERVLPLLFDAASGLMHLHKEGVLHRDIACRNMLLHAVGGRDRLVICDFGLSKVGRGARAGYYSASSEKVGACRWMAPESLRAGHFSQQTDVFSFGRAMLELVTRSRPFPLLEDNISVALAAIGEGHPPAPAALRSDRFTAAVLDLAAQCCSGDPEQRIALDDCYEALRRLGEIFSVAGVAFS